MHHLVDITTIGGWIRLQLTQLVVVGAYPGGQLFLSGAKPVESRDDPAALRVQHAEQPGQQRQQLLLPLFVCLLREGMDFVLRLRQRHAALSDLLHKVGDSLVMLPVGLLRIYLRTSPHCRK